VLDHVADAFAFYYLTSMIVVLAVLFGVDFVPLCQAHLGRLTRVDLLSGFAAWDGEWYVRIASAGYSYDPERMSSVAFFPLYPWLAGAMVHTLGLRPEWALLLVSHGALIGTFALLGAYVSRCCSEADAALPDYTVLAFGLFPTTFYFRMTYTESVFTLLAILSLYGMQRGWRPRTIAIIVGLATASRMVALALVPVLALYVWQRMKTESSSRSAHGVSGLLCLGLLRVACLLPVCCWGLLGYMLFQWVAFGEPLAFIKTQVHWTERSLTLGDRLVGLLTLEPIRAVYDSSSPCYWARVPPEGNLLFNLKAANPLYFLATVGLVVLGGCKRWLNGRELLLSAGLLVIPYALQAARTGMSSQARYAAVVFPVYLVLGQLLHRMPGPLAAALLAISGLFLAIYSAMFVSWYWFY
jgi:hypothetical protein